MKRLLAATDLSARSDRAVARAISLAAGFGARLTVLHVIDEDLPSAVAEKLTEAAQARLREHLSSIPGTADLDIDVAVALGQDWTAILERADADQAELIVLGLHRERGLAGLFRGTTVERVARGSAVPVLVAKEPAAKGYANVVVGVDFSVCSRRAVEFALGFATGAKVVLVHAYDVPFKGFLGGSRARSEVRQQHEAQLARMIDQEMAALLTGLDIEPRRIRRVMREGGPQEAISTQVAELGADLLVLGTHGRTGAAHALLGSIAEGFLTHPPCDVAVVKAW